MTCILILFWAFLGGVETGSLYIARAALGLPMKTRQPSNSHSFTFLYFPSAGVKGTVPIYSFLTRSISYSRDPWVEHPGYRHLVPTSS